MLIRYWSSDVCAFRSETARAIGIVAPVGGHIDACQTERLTFTLASSARLVFDSLTSNGNLLWSLTGPRGAEVTGRSFYSSDSAEYDVNESLLLDLPAGDYALTVDGRGDLAAD